MEKGGPHPLLLKGYTYIIYKRLVPFVSCLVVDAVEEGFYGGDRRKMGEETQKRLLPIQVRTASFFPLSGEGRDLF